MADVSATFDHSDIVERYGVSTIRAAIFLAKNQTAIEESMIRAGWDAIDNLVPYDWEEVEENSQ